MAQGLTLGPSLQVTYSTTWGGTKHGTVRSVVMVRSDVFLPQITSVTVRGETGMIDGLTGLPQVCDHRLSPGQLSDESWRAVCNAVGVNHG
jgi:hypothetical protein